MMDGAMCAVAYSMRQKLSCANVKPVISLCCMNTYHPLFMPVRPICMLDYVNATVGNVLLVLAALMVPAQPHRGTVVSRPLSAAGSRTSGRTRWVREGGSDVADSHTLSFCV